MLIRRGRRECFCVAVKHKDTMRHTRQQCGLRAVVLNVCALSVGLTHLHSGGGSRACQGFFFFFPSFAHLVLLLLCEPDVGLNSIIPQRVPERSLSRHSYLHKMLHCRCYPIMQLRLYSSPSSPLFFFFSSIRRTMMEFV